ncbi:MAG: DUF2147 domain-containing protein [Bacteroidota bacterium]|jgi:uncharacterized protein (DUF2147 family)
MKMIAHQIQTLFKSTLQMLVLSMIALVAFSFSTSFKSIEDNPEAIVGVWKTGEGNAMVRIYKNGDKYQGKVVWLKEPIDPETGKPKVDKNHPDETVRSRAILGLINVWGFVFKGNNVWDEGNIYDPKNGNTYSCTIKMNNANTLEVRGFIGVSLIGRTDTWTRQVSK